MSSALSSIQPVLKKYIYLVEYTGVDRIYLLYTVYHCIDNVTLWDTVHHEGGIAPHQ